MSAGIMSGGNAGIRRRVKGENNVPNSEAGGRREEGGGRRSSSQVTGRQVAGSCPVKMLLPPAIHWVVVALERIMSHDGSKRHIKLGRLLPVRRVLVEGTFASHPN